MNYVPNRNGKVLKKTLVGFNSDDMKTTLRRLRCFKITYFANSSKISLHSSVTSLHTIEGIMNGSEESGVTLKLVGCHFRTLGLV